MNKEKVSYEEPNYDMDKLTDPHPSAPDASDIEKIKKMYLPTSKADNKPSEESIERANDLNYSKPGSLI
ncbi:hypothetical protein [Clostridium sp. YIM B02555]|uniref:hypothetical protein n=1 Tax=Clostridium sp. YIM B02555 TaxID=2911968 RepID=UPI001EEF1F52|nr:hypothetical protein [Clostridium sp. YIM B02555]